MNLDLVLHQFRGIKTFCHFSGKPSTTRLPPFGRLKDTWWNFSLEKNYIVLEDDMVTLACYDAREKLRDIEGKVSKYRLKTDKNGNLHLDLSVKTRRNGFSRWTFIIKKGSNHCIVISNPVRKEAGFVFIGELLPYDTSGLISPFILNELERIDK